MVHKTYIRDANILDLLPLAAMAVEYASEVTTMHNHPVDIPTLMESLALSVISDKALVRVMELDGKMIGGIWGILTNLPWSKTVVAQDIIIYVKKEYRGLGGELITSWVNWSKENGAKEVSISTASGISTERFIRLMQLKGFNLQGHSLVKEI